MAVKKSNSKSSHLNEAQTSKPIRIGVASLSAVSALAKNLKDAFKAENAPTGIADCREIVAHMLGYANWFEIERSCVIGQKPCRTDKAVGAERAKTRFAHYIAALGRLRIAKPLARRVLKRADPSGSASPITKRSSEPQSQPRSLPAAIVDEYYEPLEAPTPAQIKRAKLIPLQIESHLAPHDRKNPCVVNKLDIVFLCDYLKDSYENEGFDYEIARIWSVTSKKEASRCLDDIKASTTKTDFALWKLKWNFGEFNFEDPYSFAIAATTKIGVCQSILLATRRTTIESDGKYGYSLHIDFAYTATKARGKGANATVIHGVCTQANLDLEHLADHLKSQNKRIKLKYTLSGDAYSAEGIRMLETIETQLRGVCEFYYSETNSFEDIKFIENCSI